VLEGNTACCATREQQADTAESETLCMRGNSMRENREIPWSPPTMDSAGRAGKADGRTPAVNDHGESDSDIVPAKSANKPAQAGAEPMEGRELTKGNTDQSDTRRTQCRESVPQGLERVRQVAASDRRVKFTSLFHHVTTDLLRDVFRGMNRKAAVGIDGVTWRAYEESLEGNLQDLHARLHRGAYQAKPSRRTYIPKADGRQRPLGIASLEDKLVQGAVVRVLNAIYEEDFLGFSYGFRPGRSQHDALDALSVALKRRKVNWVLDADIRGFFDAIDHEWLMKFLEHRIADKRILRLIRKWLNAGVLEEGDLMTSEIGSPQGATVSPLLANVYLHYVYDLWAKVWRRCSDGEVIIVRYADDTVVGFEHRRDADRFLAELRQRLAKFGLELNASKTRLIEFGRFAASHRQRRGLGKPETFDFLGFTHICGKSRSGRFLLHRHTIRKKLRAKLQLVRIELKRRRHLPVPEVAAWLRSVVTGHYRYFAVPTNIEALRIFREQVLRSWLHALRRRSQKSRMTWARLNVLADRWIPRARILHPWPDERFAVKTQGRSRMR